MYSKELLNLITSEIESLKHQGKYKNEAVLESPQGPKVTVNGREILMFASNNYLGLANHPEIIKAAKYCMNQFGFGMSSVRFISGTTVLHQELETKLSEFLNTEDTILFSSCFTANEAFFAAIINQTADPTRPSVIYSDELNHASIIDGLKLVKKKLFIKKIYKHNDVAALRTTLAEDQTQNYYLKIIATDGVFSTEGELANLPQLVNLGREFQALLFIDDSHGVGVTGLTGRGSAEELGVLGQIDVLSGTLGKSFGGASGGYLSGKKELIEFFRQKARPYIFSNSLPPMIVAGCLKAIELVEKHPELLKKLRTNTKYFREKLSALGFRIIPGDHPIIPIKIGEAATAQKISQELLKRGVYIVGLWFPVVAEGDARLRVQISAVHSKEDLDQAIEILEEVSKEFKVI